PTPSKPGRHPDRNYRNIFADDRVALRQVEGVNLDRHIVIIANLPVTGINFASPFAWKNRKLALKKVWHFAAAIHAALSSSRGTHTIDGTHFIGVVLQCLAELKKKPGVALGVPSSSDTNPGKQLLDPPLKRNVLADLMTLHVGSLRVACIILKGKA